MTVLVFSGPTVRSRPVPKCTHSTCAPYWIHASLHLFTHIAIYIQPAVHVLRTNIMRCIHYYLIVAHVPSPRSQLSPSHILNRHSAMANGTVSALRTVSAPDRSKKAGLATSFGGHVTDRLLPDTEVETRPCWRQRARRSTIRTLHNRSCNAARCVFEGNRVIPL